MIKKKLESAKSCLEVIEALLEYYLERWKKTKFRKHDAKTYSTINQKIVDDFYGCFLVDLEATFKKKFPEVKEYIQA